jgi:hypothetical protein
MVFRISTLPGFLEALDGEMPGCIKMRKSAEALVFRYADAATKFYAGSYDPVLMKEVQNGQTLESLLSEQLKTLKQWGCSDATLRLFELQYES